jgi:hypothetical protein
MQSQSGNFCSQLKMPVLLKSKLQVMGNRLAVMAFLEGLTVEDLADKDLLDKLDINYQLIISVLAIK